jgi:hypothetical protein
MESKKYFIVIDDERKGPLNFSELQSLNLKNDTPVWFEGMSEWSVLDKVEELASLKKVIPPDFNNLTKSPIPPQYSPSNHDDTEDVSFFHKYKAYLIVAILILGLVITYSLYSSSADNESNENNNNIATETEADANVDNYQEKVIANEELSPEDLRKQLLKKEQNNPLKYLTIGASFKENRVQTRNATVFRHSKHKSDGYIFSGFIRNSATLATFSDIVVEVSFISSTGTLISSEEIIIYDRSSPDMDINFDKKIYPPDDTSSFDYKIIRSN